MSFAPEDMRYPPASLIGDIAGAFGGIVVCSVLASVAGLWLPLRVLLAVAVLLFAWFGWQAARRFAVRYTADAGGVHSRPPGAVLAWDALTSVELRYFSVRRDRDQGWMELRLVSAERTLKVDSRLTHFPRLVALAERAALANGLTLDDVTAANIRAVETTDAAAITRLRST